MEDLRKYNPEGSTLRKAQMRMLEILKIVDSIFSKHHIDYYLDGGTLQYAVIDPSLQGMRLGDMSFESACEYNILPHPELGDSISWEELAFSDEQWVLHKIDISHVDAGSYKITINANECSEAVKIRDIRVIKR